MKKKNNKLYAVLLRKNLFGLGEWTMNWTTNLAPELVEIIDQVDQKIAKRLQEIREVAFSNLAKGLTALWE